MRRGALRLTSSSADVAEIVRSQATRADRSVYTHLAAFVRRAPASQVHAFWQAVGKATDERMWDRSSAEHAVWLSTAGMGVAWLHARLDSYPKYYVYKQSKT